MLVTQQQQPSKYGHRIRVQLYFVAKHSLVHKDMENARPNAYKIYLTSSSMHNHVKFLFILEIVFCLSNNFFWSFTKKTRVMDNLYKSG